MIYKPNRHAIARVVVFARRRRYNVSAAAAAANTE